MLWITNSIVHFYNKSIPSGESSIGWKCEWECELGDRLELLAPSIRIIQKMAFRIHNNTHYSFPSPFWYRANCVVGISGTVCNIYVGHVFFNHIHPPITACFLVMIFLACTVKTNHVFLVTKCITLSEASLARNTSFAFFLKVNITCTLSIGVLHELPSVIMGGKWAKTRSFF